MSAQQEEVKEFREILSLPSPIGEDGRAHVVVSRVGNEAWMEFYAPGVRVRFEICRADLDDAIAILERIRQEIDAEPRVDVTKRAGKARIGTK